jgi:hypothetical protein
LQGQKRLILSYRLQNDLLLDISQISRTSLISIVEGVLKQQQRAAGSVGCGVKKKDEKEGKERRLGQHSLPRRIHFNHPVSRFLPDAREIQALFQFFSPHLWPSLCILL